MPHRALALVMLAASCSFDPRNAVTPDSPDTGPASDANTPDGPSPADATPIDAAPIDAVTSASATDHVAIADVYLNSVEPDSSMAGDAFVIVDGNPLGVGLLQFDLTALAATQVIAAELHIWTDFDPGNTVQIAVMLESWTESGATFNDRSTNLEWSATGAGTPTSRSTVSIGSFTPNAQFTEFTVPLDAAAIASWVTSPATNFGLAIFSVNSDGPRFVSREGPVDRRPTLRVTHLP
jgi:hypothetical protein